MQMFRITFRRAVEYVAISVATLWLLEAGCLARLQNEMEWLFAPDALGNRLFIRESILYQLFGARVLQFFS